MTAEALPPLTGGPAGPARTLSIPGFRVKGPIGRGGVSTVYLAERAPDGMEVAVKLLDGKLQQSQNFLPRFIREQQIIARLESPSVVKILGHGFSDEFVYIVMEYLEGEDLSHYIRLGMRPRQALAVLYQAGLALRLIHSHGVIHRDIKPTNIMFRRDGTLVVVDFGFSKMAQDDPGLTRQGQVVGTPQYMSPEQAKGLPLDPRTDLYSMGVVLYEMLMGRKLFAGARELPTHTRDKAPIPLLPEPLVPFQVLLERLLARRREDRFPSADAMLDYVTRMWGVPRAKIVEFVERIPEGGA
ncbi:MAG TPA: serine/threonine-protein kinase [Burkholderiales bacterium]|nr:serine/threonine-protein kinase [Burkholderiales bacterium]